MIHPLTGSDPVTLARLLARHGPPERTSWPRLAGAFGSAVARAPASALERGYVSLAVARSPDPAPVFVLGHWRSGTTHLFNLLSGAPGVTYAAPIPTGLPWDFLLLGRALRPVLTRAIPSRRGIDPMAVTPDAPQEDEIALAGMGAPSYYHGVYFARAFRREMARGLFFDGCRAGERARWQRALHRFTAKIAHAGGGRRVLVKNPAHTAKVPEIRAIWPEARFIHIVRNPYHVYQSTVRMFDDLLAMLALQPVDRAEMLAAIHETYPRMMRAIDAATHDLPESQMATVRFEDLETDPLAEVRRITGQLGFAEPDAAEHAARRHLETVAGYRSRTREIPPAVADTVERHWGAERARWGYARAEGAGSA